MEREEDSSRLVSGSVNFVFLLTLTHSHNLSATNASFGLGIDNPSVRYVVHHTLAKSLANFYQEGGRAGRDGLPSDCITFFRAADASRLSTLIYETWFSGGKEKRESILC